MQLRKNLLQTALAFPLALFLFTPTFAQKAATPPAELEARIHAALDASDSTSALNYVRALREADENFFASNNYDYLLGRLSEKAGDTATSQANYEAVIARKSLLSSYALWHLAKIARSSGDLVLERQRLREFLISAPTAPLRDTANLRLAKSFYESGDDNSVVTATKALIDSKNVPMAREALALTGQALFRLGKRQEAHDIFARVLMRMPDASRPDDFALAAARGLDSIESSDNQASTNASKPAISEAEHLLRASVYHFNRDFNAARTHYAAVVSDNPQSPSVPFALYQIGRGYFSQGNYDEALKNFKRVTDEFPESTSARDALTYTAGSYNRMKRTDDAVATYELLLKRFPDAPNPERVYLNIIDSLYESRRYPQAHGWVLQARARFPNQIGSTLALFADVRMRASEQAWAAVVAETEELKKISDLGGARVAGGTTKAEVIFLQAYALEQLGKKEQAIDLYLSIPDGRNEYYGQKATDRLRALASASDTADLSRSREQYLVNNADAEIGKGDWEQARQSAQSALRLATDTEAQQCLDILRRAYANLPAYNLRAFNVIPLTTIESTSNDSSTEAIANALLALGVYDEALPALSVMTSAKSSNIGSATQELFADRDYTIAVLSLRGEHASDAIRFGERFWKTVPADYVLAIAPRQLLDLLYPAPYRDSLLRHATPRNVDARFVLSIARQESRFQPEAKSAAAARGMMQFISETADATAKKLDKKNFQEDELYDPDTAVLFGSQYLSSLFEEFPNQPEAVAAAYNGGADNVARWIARSGATMPERYVPELGFAQTKDYVFKVMTNFRAYQQLYDSKLQRQ